MLPWRPSAWPNYPTQWDISEAAIWVSDTAERYIEYRHNFEWCIIFQTLIAKDTSDVLVMLRLNASRLHRKLVVVVLWRSTQLVKCIVIARNLHQPPHPAFTTQVGYWPKSITIIAICVEAKPISGLTDAPLKKQIFDITKLKWEPKIPHNSKPNNLWAYFELAK